jgi:hypothetical protein
MLKTNVESLRKAGVVGAPIPPNSPYIDAVDIAKHCTINVLRPDANKHC